LYVDTHLQALGFLRDQLEAGGINVEAEIAALVDSESLAKLDADQE